jgi:hypothetical protein
VADRRYIVGERVLASRAENGKDHEEATVVDYYVLLMEGGSIPSIVVDFDDGERKYMTASETDILPLPEEDEEEEWDEDEAPEEPESAGGDDAESLTDAEDGDEQ